MGYLLKGSPFIATKLVIGREDIPDLTPGNVIAAVCDKGGVGKTITVVHLAAGYARLAQVFGLDWRVLVVDMDPQSSAVAAVQDPERPFDERRTLAALLADDHRHLRPHDFVEPSPWVPGHLFYIPSDKPSLEAVLDHLHSSLALDLVLRRILKPILGDYHFILIDTGGRVSDTLVRNALVAATHVLVPLNSDFMGLESVPRTNETLDLVRQAFEQETPHLLGYLLTLYRHGVGASVETETRLRHKFGDEVFKTVIPLTTALPDSLSNRMDVFTHAPSSQGAHAYRDLLIEVLNRVATDQNHR